MVDYITDSGFDKPTLPETIQEIGDAMEVVVGPINREADSTTGQWIGVEAEANAVQFEGLEELWMSRFLAYAEGAALDALGIWMGGITRAPETTTKVNAAIYGSESRLIPAGALASFGNYQFKLTADSTISRTALLDGQIKVTNATAAAYTVRIAGTDYAYSRQSTDTVNSIATALALLIDGTQQYSSNANGSVINLTSENQIEGYSVSLSSGLQWQRIGSPAIFEAIEAGAIVVPVGGLNNPVSAIAGWTGVNNLVQGSTGSGRESDTNYRARLRLSRSSSGGAATIPAIETRLLTEVEGVSLAVVIENDTMATVNSIPPKAIHTIVQGGLEQEIADAIWKYKGAGIETYGNIPITVRDRYDRPHLVKFSRPADTPIYVRVDVTLLDPEEPLPSAVVNDIKQGVVDYGGTLGLGDDVITQRIYGYIYSNTTGIGKMTITVSLDGVGYNESNIPVGDSAYATFSSNNVEVTGV